MTISRLNKKSYDYNQRFFSLSREKIAGIILKVKNSNPIQTPVNEEGINVRKERGENLDGIRKKIEAYNELIEKYDYLQIVNSLHKGNLSQKEADEIRNKLETNLDSFIRYYGSFILNDPSAEKYIPYAHITKDLIQILNSKYPKQEKSITEMRKEAIDKLSSMDKELKNYPYLKMMCDELCKNLKNKTELKGLLLTTYNYLTNRFESDSYLLAKEKDKEKKDFYKTEMSLCSKIQDIIFDLSAYYLKKYDVLQLSESGINRYPEKHSFFAMGPQELGGGVGLYARTVIEMKKSYGSIENALIRAGRDYTIEKPFLWLAPTHRLSKFSTKDNNNIDFEILFINGAENPGEPEGLWSKDTKYLQAAIKEVYKDKCKEITPLNQPSEQDFKDSIKAIADRCKNNGRKLYVFYTGHGSALSGNQDGIPKNWDKEGAREYYFQLNKGPALTERKIKELYNTYLKDIEVITIFDSCHSGAGITAIENKRFDFFA